MEHQLIWNREIGLLLCLKKMKTYEQNTYFILTLPEPALDAILTHTVEKAAVNARKLYGGSICVKLPVDAKIPSVLSSLKAYTHAEVLIEIAKREAGRPQI